MLDEAQSWINFYLCLLTKEAKPIFISIPHESNTAKILYRMWNADLMMQKSVESRVFLSSSKSKSILKF